MPQNPPAGVPRILARCAVFIVFTRQTEHTGIEGFSRVRVWREDCGVCRYSKFHGHTLWSCFIVIVGLQLKVSRQILVVPCAYQIANSVLR